MPLINTSVPNLIQGVSQQPDATRFDGQCEEQENALSSVAEGLKKRPNTRHVARLLETAIDGNSFVHFVNRSDAEKYVMIHDGTKLQAWNILTGNEATINGSTGGYIPSSGSYLASNTPKTALKGLTVADTTFILNTTKGVALNQNKTPALDKEALIFIKQGDYRKRYEVNIDLNPLVGNNYVTATATATLTRYLHRTDVYTVSSGSSSYTQTDKYFRWRITAVTIDTAGSDYEEAFVQFFSDMGVYTDAVYDASVSAIDGSIESVTLAGTEGDYEGVGVNLADASGGARKTLYGEDAPNISVSISPSSSFNTNATSLMAFSYSGKGSNGESSDANTDSIAYWLAGEGQSNYTASGYQPMTADNGGVNNTAISDYFDITRAGGLIKLTKKSSWDGDFTINTVDSLGDTGMTSIYKEVSSITDLPSNCFNGFKVKVIGDYELSQDDYYVEFQTSTGNNVGEGSWVECAGFEIEKGFDSSTMPITFKNNDSDSFLFEDITYSERTAGDTVSNPNPSFVGSEISNMFFFKNRLGFLSHDNVVFSESGLGGINEDGIFSYNFFRTTVSSLLDSAPIDVSVSSTRVTKLESAVGFQESLVLFSKTGQFVLKGSDILTPKTISITPATNFDYTESVPPLPLGSYIYYPFNRGSFTGLREFTVNASTDNYDSAEVTEHIPSYIPSNLVQMKGTTSEDIIALVSGDESNAIYIYNYFWNNNQKVLSAWSKFTFTGEIRGIEFIESTLYAVMVNNGETNLVEMPLESGLSDAAGYVTHLDNRVAVTVTNGSSTITLPYTPADNSVEVYTTDGLALNCTNSGSTVTLSSPVSADTDVWVGIPYTMKYTFSEQLFKAKAGNGKSPSNAAKMMIRNGSLYYDKSAYFKVKVTPKFRDTYENTFTPDVVGSSVIGSLSLDSGFYRFPVFTKPQDTTITIENESALPSTFQSAEFESFVHSRSNRYG